MIGHVRHTGGGVGGGGGSCGPAHKLLLETTGTSACHVHECRSEAAAQTPTVFYLIVPGVFSCWASSSE